MELKTCFDFSDYLHLTICSQNLYSFNHVKSQNTNCPLRIHLHPMVIIKKEKKQKPAKYWTSWQVGTLYIIFLRSDP